MSGTDVGGKKVGLRRQWSLCVIMVAVAWLICAASHMSFVGLFDAPISLAFQGCVAAGLVLASGINAWVSHKLFARRSITQHMIESYSRLELRGWNPVLIALAAGIGEEILFRGALQSLAGVGVSSALFVLAHAKAYRFNTVDRRVLLQAIGILAISLVLAVVTSYAGLLSAVVLHTAIDIGGLLSVRHFASGLTPESSARSAPLHGGA
jgi:membrane protease YdiL (CAAX protease family)